MWSYLGFCRTICAYLDFSGSIRAPVRLSGPIWADLRIYGFILRYLGFRGSSMSWAKAVQTKWQRWAPLGNGGATVGRQWGNDAPKVGRRWENGGATSRHRPPHQRATNQATAYPAPGGHLSNYKREMIPNHSVA